MFDDLQGKKTGERIQIIRERKGMSRLIVAGLVGRSPQWLKDIEKSRRLPPRLPMLLRLADVLGVGDLAVLIGTDMDLHTAVSLPVSSLRRIPHEAVPAIREAIHSQTFTPPDPVDVKAVRQRTADAWRLWHASPTQRTDVGRILPALITDARAATRTVDGPARRTAYAVLAEVYALCEQMLAWTSEPDLLMVAADRGATSAQEADQPETLAGAAWVLGNVHRAKGDYDTALRLVMDAAAVLQPRLEDGPDSLRGMWGALQLHAAITCARAGRDGDAWHHWELANGAAERLGTYLHPWTQFGAANVAVHAVSIGADLSKSAAARERAETIAPETIPSLERRSRLLIETARSYHLKRDYSGTLDWLRHAHKVSREAVHYSPLARQMAADVVDHGGPLIERKAKGFAQVLGLPV
ncbi:hypothetical protein Acsp04_15680 [Actinomadura sp. NBRC 104425]|uniref:helix-turn-helix domain-containing protein n=1 Tax=Actinomadura sp. NBRC 104425 TaxID=3032204 RepID=UPI0024A5A4A6|nr:helix-turn-helix domain-containing protein [Actinomadura sp. NBRC 104425]GLZ11333.1 hypothetical protein Acsp04_15680 [Actinomadura sp. NBRC 104425]